MSFSELDLQTMQTRLARNRRTVPAVATLDAVPDGEEAKLHEQIIAELRALRWLYSHSRMDKRATVQPGTPDFTIFPPGGKAFFVECKTRTGKLTAEQTAFKHCAEASDYRFALVRSMAEFHAAVRAGSP